MSVACSSPPRCHRTHSSTDVVRWTSEAAKAAFAAAKGHTPAGADEHYLVACENKYAPPPLGPPSLPLTSSLIHTTVRIVMSKWCVSSCVYTLSSVSIALSQERRPGFGARCAYHGSDDEWAHTPGQRCPDKDEGESATHRPENYEEETAEQWSEFRFIRTIG
jgi:hypothetical protein